MLRTPAETPCTSLSCSGLCLRSAQEAECLCTEDSPGADSCRFLTSNPSQTDSGEEASDDVTKTKTSKQRPVTVALAVILAFAGVSVLVILYYKCKRSPKSDISLS